MTRDRNKKIWTIKYNVLNLPEQIEYMDGHIVQYTYAADGRKLMVKYMVSNISVIEQGSINTVGGSSNGVMGGGIIPFDPPGPIVPPGPTTYLTMDYCGNHIYRNGVLERTINDYGYQADSTYYYYIKDYQGNVRAIIDQNGMLKEISNYYPYGGLMGAASAGVQPNKYGGKELDRENGIDWYDFEARYQDPMLPMFTTQDPLIAKYPNISPYAYCASNPVINIDPDGKDWVAVKGSSNIFWDDNVNSKTKLKDNLEYVGANADQILSYFNLKRSKTIYSKYTGMVAGEATDYGATGHWINVNERTTVIIDPIIKYDNNKKSNKSKDGKVFDGLKISVHHSSYHTAIDGEMNPNGGSVTMRYASKTQSSNLKLCDGPIIHAPNSFEYSTFFNISRKDLSKRHKPIRIEVEGNWFVHKPGGNTPVVCHSLFPLPRRYKQTLIF